MAQTKIICPRNIKIYTGHRVQSYNSVYMEDLIKHLTIEKIMYPRETMRNVQNGCSPSPEVHGSCSTIKSRTVSLTWVFEWNRDLRNLKLSAGLVGGWK